MCSLVLRSLFEELTCLALLKSGRVTMSGLDVISGIKKLNGQNYDTWSTCMESEFQGEDLWEIVGGSDVVPPEDPASLKKWKVRAGKAMFAIKITIEEELLEHIRQARTPKEAWDIFAVLFSKKNEARLQLLKNELLSVTQSDTTISQYFTKVKSLCSEISILDPSAVISESRIKRIIIRGMRQEYRSFIATVQDWPTTQPSLVELENLLVDQETLLEQLSNASNKKDGEALLNSNSKRLPHKSVHRKKRKGGSKDG